MPSTICLRPEGGGTYLERETRDDPTCIGVLGSYVVSYSSPQRGERGVAVAVGGLADDWFPAKKRLSLSLSLSSIFGKKVFRYLCGERKQDEGGEGDEDEEEKELPPPRRVMALAAAATRIVFQIRGQDRARPPVPLAGSREGGRKEEGRKEAGC